MQHRILSLALCTISALSLGCSTLKGWWASVRPLPAQPAVASNHVAVLSVIPWSTYSDKLQPVFELKPEDALTKSVPVTARLQTQVFEALVASIQVAPPTSSRTTNSTRNVGPDLVVNQTNQTTDQTGPGTITPREPMTVPPLSRGLTDKPDPSIDPFLQYLSATALQQEVAMLSAYVKYAVQRQGYKAYAIRLQVSLMPLEAGAPYDAYSNVSFFSVPRGATYDGDTRIFQNNVNIYNALLEMKQPWNAASAQNRRLPVAVSSAEATKCGALPEIVPLLVTDSVQAAIDSRSAETLRQLSLSLTALVQGFAVNAAGDFARRELEESLAYSVSSALTVGRASSNTLRVRLGAHRVARDSFEMVPRTHSITALLLVPEGCGSVNLVARTDLADPRSGRILRARSNKEAAKSARSAVCKYWSEGTCRITGDKVDVLVGAAQTGQWPAFTAALEDQRSQLTLDAPEQLWLDLVSSRVGSSYSSVNVELPEPGTSP